MPEKSGVRSQEWKNIIWLTVASLLAGAGAALFGGEIFTGFLAKTNFSNLRIGAILSAGQFASAFGLLAFMGLADRIQKRIRVYVICIVAVAMFPIVTILVVRLPRSVVTIAALFGFLIAMNVIQTLIASITVMLDYPIIVRTATQNTRGKLFGLQAISYSLLAIVLGVVSAAFLKNLAYPLGYACCFLVASAAMLLRAGAYSRLKELPELAVPGASKSPLPFRAIVDVLKMKEFQLLAPPHVLRGMVLGVAGLVLPLAIKNLHLPNEIPGYATSANALAGILGGVTIGLIADRIGAGKTTLIGDTLLALGMGAVICFNNTYGFLAFYFLMHFGRNIEDSAVPLGAINIVPPQHMGAFSAARLMVMNWSSALGTLVFAFLFDHYSPVIVFGIGAAIKLFNGVWFWYVFKISTPAAPRVGDDGELEVTRLDYLGMSCPFCHASLDRDADTAVCPSCGAAIQETPPPDATGKD